MSITAKDKGGNFELVPAGTFVARCYQMIDLGTIKEVIKGITKELHKVRITWELPTEKKVFDEAKGPQPFTVSKDFTLSMNKKANLRKFLEGWRGLAFTEEEAKVFDITILIGKTCMLSLIHKTSQSSGNQYVEISSVTTLMKVDDGKGGKVYMSVPEAINPPFVFTLENFDQAKFDACPDWLKEKIITSVEYKALKNPGHVETTTESAIDNSQTVEKPPF